MALKKDSAVDNVRNKAGHLGLWHWLLIICLLHNVPIIGYLMPSPLYIIVLLFFYVTSIYVWGSEKMVSFTKISLPILSVAILKGLFDNISGEGSFPEFVYSLVQLMVYPIAVLCLLSDNNTQLNKKICFVLIALYVITSITTIIGNVRFPNASRNLAGAVGSESIEYPIYMLNNIGGFSYSYISLLFIPLLIVAFRLNVIGPRLVSLITICLFSVAIYYTDYTTAFLFLLLSLILFFVPIQFTRKKVWIYIFLVVIVFFIFKFVIIIILDSLSKLIESENILSRLNDLADTLSGGLDSLDEQSDVSSRSDVMQHSWEIFLNNPLGIWSNAGIGGHSLILDTLARFGFIGAAAIIITFKKMKKLYIEPFQSEFWYGFLLIIYIESICLAVVNTHIFYLILCFAAPLMASIISSENSIK